jgi:hypothetical protein
MPRPLAADGAVTIDARERTLVVKPAGHARAYAKVLRSEGHRAQLEDQQAMIPRAPTVWAHGAGQDKIVYGLPGADGTLRFRFSLGDPVYRKLVSTPGSDRDVCRGPRAAATS